MRTVGADGPERWLVDAEAIAMRPNGLVGGDFADGPGVSVNDTVTSLLHGTVVSVAVVPGDVVICGGAHCAGGVDEDASRRGGAVNRRATAGARRGRQRRQPRRPDRADRRDDRRRDRRRDRAGDRRSARARTHRWRAARPRRGAGAPPQRARRVRLYVARRHSEWAAHRPAEISPTSSTTDRSSSTDRCCRRATSTACPRRPHRHHSRRRADRGIATVNGDCFGGHAARCVVASYDYTVLAGTQGAMDHRKKDRLFELAVALRLPVVLFTEGGGGRPGDTDAPGPTGARLPCVHVRRRAVGAGATRRRQRRLLLRRQRRAARLLRTS